MFKLLVVLFAIVAIVAAGQGGDVDEALLARVAQILSENESSGGSGGGGGSLDADLLARVSQVISQSEGSSSGSSRGSSGSYGAPPPSDSYGPPSGGSRSGSSGIQIGSPERAERVAEFDLSSSSGGQRDGGYSGSNSGGGYN